MYYKKSNYLITLNLIFVIVILILLVFFEILLETLDKSTIFVKIIKQLIFFLHGLS